MVKKLKNKDIDKIGDGEKIYIMIMISQMASS